MLVGGLWGVWGWGKAGLELFACEEGKGEEEEEEYEEDSDRPVYI